MNSTHFRPQYDYFSSHSITPTTSGPGDSAPVVPVFQSKISRWMPCSQNDTKAVRKNFVDLKEDVMHTPPTAVGFEV